MTEVIREDLIDLNLEGKTKQEIVGKMASMLEAAGLLTSKEGYLADVFAREQLGTTGFGMSLAIPHGKSQYVKQAAVGIARLTCPIDWNSLDGQLVNFVFLLAVPRSELENEVHLALISQLAEQLMEAEFRQKLFQAQSAQDIIELIKFN